MSLRTLQIVVSLSVGIAIASAAPAWAKPGFALIKLSPSQFVSNCESQGGTATQAPTGGIRCTLPGGQVVECSFDTTTGDALCQWTKDLPPKSAKALMGDLPPDSLAPTTAKPPKATGAPATVN